MKILDLENWNRKGHFEFFTQFEEPFFGITAPVEVATAYENAKATQTPFFIYYLHKILTAVNAIENFKYRIKDQQIIIHDRIDTSATIMREDKTFGFSYIEFHPDLEIFKKIASKEIARIQNTTGIITREYPENIIHFSAIPWLNFTGLTHARSFTWPDSCPKISVGKIFEENSNQKMNVSVTVHHGLMDGYHVSLFFEELQKQLNS
ncbi:MAG: CatA-like O-acetyltransferase [Flavobacterium sp.]